MGEQEQIGLLAKRPVLVLFFGLFFLAALAAYVFTRGGRGPSVPSPDAVREELSASSASSRVPSEGQRMLQVAASVGAPFAEGTVAVAVEPRLVEQADQVGVLPSQRLEYLVNAHEHVMRLSEDASTPGWQRIQAQRLFLLRCAAAILHKQGRAIFLRNAEEAAAMTGWSASTDPNRVTFSADGAAYEFWRGEFVELDLALDSLESSEAGVLVPPTDQAMIRFYERALASFNDEYTTR